MSLALQAILALISCGTISVLFNIDKKNIPLCAINGSICWCLFQFLSEHRVSYIFAALLCSVVVGFFGEIFARWHKVPVNCFFIIGIIPLVPGLKIYQTMIHFVNNDIKEGAKEGVQAIFIAIGIAVGLVIVSSISKILRERKRIRSITEKQKK